MTTRRKKQTPPVKAWGGFSDGKLHWFTSPEHFQGEYMTTRPAIYPSRKQARQQYEDVRKIEIREVRK
jgi:hypothetical protein